MFDASQAGDLTRNTLERALTHWHRFDQQRNMRVWLLSIAYNAHLDAYRRDSRLSVIDPAELQRSDLVAHHAPGATGAGGWVQPAGAAHAVYAPEVRHPVEVDTTLGTDAEQRAQEEHLSRWLTKRPAMPVKLFDLRAQGFQRVGGRLLPDLRSPSAQLMYQNAAGQRITVYLRKPEASTPAAFR